MFGEQYTQPLTADAVTVVIFKEYMEGFLDVAPTGAPPFKQALELWDDVVLYEKATRHQNLLKAGTLLELVTRVN